jgi:hypothetical protein
VADGPRTAIVSIPQEIAWRVFTKGMDRAEAQRLTTMSGDKALGGRVLQMLSVMA